MTKPRIWVLDDEPFLRKILAFMLDGEGYEVECLQDGETAWAKLSRGERPDLVISDVMMPGLSGIELLKRIRSERISIPVLVLTARGRAQDEREILDAGADAFMAKPFHSKTLAAKVAGMLAARGAPGEGRGSSAQGGAIADR